ncbi:MAG: hypothetical protein DWC10_02310 [Candidatus Poseidoniales archaeon]|nr:MAG: hypothetical protein DWC10_02310 [Candidatus Poseidoniales archaeon]
MRLRSLLLTVVVLLPLLSSSGPVPQPVQAASQCQGEISTTLWNTTVQRHALVPFSFGFMPFNEDGKWEDDGPEPSSSTDFEHDPSLHPEDPWMYNPSWPLPTLEPLQTNHYMTMEIGNDSAGALRFNLSSAHRTTFCVNLNTEANNLTEPVNADIYLLTSQQYDRYQEAYRMMHGGWWWQDMDLAGGDSDVLSDIPPEWRSFNPLGWQTYRDVHQYQERSEATFSLSLDGPQVYTSMFDGDTWEDFYLIIDTWDNTNDNDADASNAVVLADVTVITEERSVLFPPWTVPLFLLGVIVSAVVVPLVLNKRYMGAGLDGAEASTKVSVPVLEQASTAPAHAQEEEA